MATIRFEPAGVEVPGVGPGTAIIDVTDEVPAAGVPYACRSASCGACRVRVLQGGDALAAPEPDEKEVLEIFDEVDGVRLCCQARLERDVERIVLEVIR